MLYILFPWCLALAWSLHQNQDASVHCGQEFLQQCQRALQAGAQALPLATPHLPAWGQVMAQRVLARHHQGESVRPSLIVVLAYLGRWRRLSQRKARLRRLLFSRLGVMGMVCALVRINIFPASDAWYGHVEEKDLALAAAVCVSLAFAVFFSLHPRWWLLRREGQAWLLSLLALQPASGFAGTATMAAIETRGWQLGVSVQTELLSFLEGWGNEQLEREEAQLQRLEDAMAACELIGSGLPAFLLLMQPIARVLGMSR